MPHSNLFKAITSALFSVALGVLVYFALSKTYQAGYAAGSNEIQTQWQAAQQEQQAQMTMLNEQVATLQHDLDTQAIQFERTSHEQKQAIHADYERRLDALSALHPQRVYIPAKIPDDYCDTPNHRASTITLRETRCELDPKTVADLARIARDGDLAITERNELIERYNKAREALSTLSKQKHLTHPQ